MRHLQSPESSFPHLLQESTGSVCVSVLVRVIVGILIWFTLQAKGPPWWATLQWGHGHERDLGLFGPFLFSPSARLWSGGRPDHYVQDCRLSFWRHWGWKVLSCQEVQVWKLILANIPPIEGWLGSTKVSLSHVSLKLNLRWIESVDPVATFLSGPRIEPQSSSTEVSTVICSSSVRSVTRRTSFSSSPAAASALSFSLKPYFLYLRSRRVGNV